MTMPIDAAILALGSKIIENEIKVKTLMEILIEKEIVTAEELNEKYKFVIDRDFEKLDLELNESLKQFAEETTDN